MKSAIAISSILATVAVSAQTGDFGRAAYMGDGMMGGTTAGNIISTLLWVGVTLLVWLWVFKLWKDLSKKR